MKYLDYNENKQHGSADFPIQYYYVSDEHQQYIMPLHWHKEFEIIRVLSGTFDVFLDNVEYSLTKGDIVLVECGVLHRGEPNDCVYECAVFDINMLRKHHNDIISQYLLPIVNHTVKLKCFFKSGQDGGIAQSVDSLFTTLNAHEKNYEFSVFRILYNFFEIIFNEGLIFESKLDKHSNKQLKTVMELIDWIETNYTEPISLTDLSAVSGMSEKYLCRFFKEFTGKTPVDYIIGLRVESACHELFANDLSVTETAIKCGFNDSSYFSKVFKKYKGMTPREYKLKQEHSSL